MTNITLSFVTVSAFYISLLSYCQPSFCANIFLQLKWLNRLATVQDDGTVKFEVPEDIKHQSLDFGTGVVYDGDSDKNDVDALDDRDIPPRQIVALIVGTRGDVQPFVAIGKRLQVISIFWSKKSI